MGEPAGKFRDWMQGDEIVRVTQDDDLQFGRILEENINQKSFKVLWKPKASLDGFLDENYTPDEHSDKVVRLIDRQHHEGEKVVHNETGKIGEIVHSKVFASLYVPDLRCVIQGVPMSLLTVFTLSTGERIFYKGWIGKVACVKYNVLVEYSDGTRGIMEMGQHVRSNVSFGFDSLPKCTPPFPGIILKPRAKEFENMEWLGSGLMDTITHLFTSHRDETCKVIRSTMKRVHVKWLFPCPLDDENANASPHHQVQEPPNPVLESHEIVDIVDFDMQFKNWMKMHSICQYTIREDDEGLDENVVEDRFIQNIINQGVGPHQEVKRPRLTTTSDEYKPPTPGDKHFVEVVRVNHSYWVDWTSSYGEVHDEEDTWCEGGDPKYLTGYKLEAGCDLSPFFLKSDDPYPRLEPFKLHDRGYVLPKFALEYGDDVRDLIGVTQHRDLKNELYLVDFYGGFHDEKEQVNRSRIFLGRREIPKFDLYKHCVFGGLKPGSIVSKREISPESGILHNIGTVLRINPKGLVEVHFGMYFTNNRSVLCSPNDLIHRIVPKENNVHQDSCSGKCQGLGCVLDEERVDFTECVANDLREFLDNEINPLDIQIKQKLPGNIDSFSVLMTGPKGSPYEHGLFVFDLNIPPAYPTVPPLIKLKTLPPCGAFLSYHFAEDWTVLHPRYKNWEPENSKGHRWGWTRNVSLLDFLQEIRKDVFATEPILEKVGLRFKNKTQVFRPATNLTIAAIAKNAGIVVTTLDMLIEMKNTKNEFWDAEITNHYAMVKSLLKSKLEYWLTTPCGVYGDTCMIPKFQIFPISSGFRRSLARRIDILALPEDNPGSDDEQ